MIARDARWTPRLGLEVHDKDGHKVGHIHQASDAQGWMQVEALGLGLQRLWIPYRLIKRRRSAGTPYLVNGDHA